jgi:4-nitrophenyl phosphatase
MMRTGYTGKMPVPRIQMPRTQLARRNSSRATASTFPPPRSTIGDMDFSAYQAVLLDLDGTVYHEDQPLPGAIELIRRLQSEGQRFACLSHSSSSPLGVVERLASMGVEVDPDNIYTAAAASCDYVLEKYTKDDAGQARRPRVYNLGSTGIHAMLDGLVDWVQTGGEPCDAVIVAAPTTDFAREEDRRRIALQLARRGADVIGMCADRVYPSPRGLEFGAGALTWMLAYAAGVEPVFCGKPQPLFFHELCKRLSIDPRWCLLIGDNLESDVAGGKGVGMRTIITLGGVTRRSDLRDWPANLQPDLVVEDLTELL